MEDCIHDEGRALRADGDALWTIECTELIHVTNEPGTKAFHWEIFCRLFQRYSYFQSQLKGSHRSSEKGVGDPS